MLRQRAAQSAKTLRHGKSGWRTFGTLSLAKKLTKRVRGTLELADGSRFDGYSFGDPQSKVGEVVFNTGMVGYPESLSDPSYKGQIVVMTYPLIGNYGVPALNRDKWGLIERFESPSIHVHGMIVGDYSYDPSHWASQQSLASWLKTQNVPALFGIDTRALTKRIRDKASNQLLGRIAFGEALPFVDPNKENLIEHTSRRIPQTYGDEAADVHILALDLGMKESIIRQLANRGAKITVVPWNYKIAQNLDKYDGLFLSNGPGDPGVPVIASNNIKEVLQLSNPKPVFGICMGHQLLARAAGATTYKMRFGHRGHNQPCIDLTTGRCHITSQNHGYVVDFPASSYKFHQEWEPYFMNANDQSNEGMIHRWKPIFSAQFHPEGNGGPEDTTFLFDRFLSEVRKHKLRPSADISSISAPSETNRLPSSTVNLKSVGPQLLNGTPLLNLLNNGQSESPGEQLLLPKKVLVLGSGGLQIGQAGEFDYSGSQAIKALKEEGVKCILINPNIANVQTAKGLADEVYFNPVTVAFVESVIQKERPEGIFLQFGGQTALNVGVELDRKGILRKYGVKVYGTSVESIVATEDRDIFKQKLKEIGEPVAHSIAANNTEEAVAAANTLGYPLIGRAAFALGGLGSGFANNEAELRELCEKAFTVSPQMLIERSLLGWKELEYEVVRDSFDNCVTVCNMENIDPLGIHTGDSIVIAPSQTLDDKEYQMLRASSIAIVRHLGIIGECNVQYALSPNNRDYCVIEVNPRLSRSSALASKATGYPLAFVAAKLALGHRLTDIKNKITQVTSACFEPSLDYVVVKVPRWDLHKFHGANRKLGSAMKSVGEVMAVGRSFEETFQKALRMVDSSVQGFDVLNSKAVHKYGKAELDELLQHATDQRIHAIAQAFERGYTVDQIHDLSKIDKWFLAKFRNIHEIGMALQEIGDLSAVSTDLMRLSKQRGYSDQQIANFLNRANKKSKPVDALAIRQRRTIQGITPVVKQIDTLAAEYPAKTNYLYVTYNGSQHDVQFEESGIVVLGSGGYSIGNSVEFDYSCMSAVRTLRKLNQRSIMINFNPETVSTDYDESDRLYFEELSLERVLDILELERPTDTMVSVGGQIANNLAPTLHSLGVRILGTSPDFIDQAEDRKKFSALMDSVGIQQPAWNELTDLKQAYAFADKVGYPVLVRPSYVLSGAAMKVVWDKHHMEEYLKNAQTVSKEYPVVISKFIQDAIEVDFDGVAQNGELVVHAVCEHVEKAGIHSGDATLVFPPFSISQSQQNAIIEAGRKIALALQISGPFNSQFIVRGDDIMVIECNVRASRSLPFVSKCLDVDFISLATQIMLGRTLQPIETSMDFVAVKVPQFSFRRLPGADPITGVEMASTGEVACFGRTKEEAFLKALLSSNIPLPGKTVAVHTDIEQAAEFAPYVAKLSAMGYEVHSTNGAAEVFARNGATVIAHTPEALIRLFSERKISFAFTFPTARRTESNEELSAYAIRTSAVSFAVPLCNNLQVGKLLVDALASVEEFSSISFAKFLEHGALSGRKAYSRSFSDATLPLTSQMSKPTKSLDAA